MTNQPKEEQITTQLRDQNGYGQVFPMAVVFHQIITTKLLKEYRLGKQVQFLKTLKTDTRPLYPPPIR